MGNVCDYCMNDLDQHEHDDGCWRARLDEAERQLAESKAREAAALAVIESQGRDHTRPCSLGSLCPWCHAESLSDQLAFSREQESLWMDATHRAWAVVARVKDIKRGYFDCRAASQRFVQDSGGAFVRWKDLDAILQSTPKVKVVDGYAFGCQLDHLDDWPWDDGFFRVFPVPETEDPLFDEPIKLVPARFIIERGE